MTLSSLFRLCRFDPFLREAVRVFCKEIIDQGMAGIPENNEQVEYYVAFHSLPTVQR